MLSREQQVKALKQKLNTIPFNRTEYTALSPNEVRAVYATLGISYNLVVWSRDSATYYKYEFSQN